MLGEELPRSASLPRCTTTCTGGPQGNQTSRDSCCLGVLKASSPRSPVARATALPHPPCVQGKACGEEIFCELTPRRRKTTSSTVSVPVSAAFARTASRPGVLSKGAGLLVSPPSACAGSLASYRTGCRPARSAGRNTCLLSLGPSLKLVLADFAPKALRN